MILNTIVAVVLVLIIGGYLDNLANAQVDPLNDIEFLQTGEIQTTENQFHISNELNIREFFDGDIIRISGQTIEGFPYVTYSQIFEDGIETHGMIFISGKFEDLSFNKKLIITEEPTKKNDDLAIATQYTQRAHSKETVQINVKIFDSNQNKLNKFYQNFGQITNVNVMVSITDDDKKIIFTSEGITNNKGLFESKFQMPDNSKRETLTITINAENADSKSSKILQLFSLGNIPTDGGP